MILTTQVKEKSKLRPLSEVSFILMGIDEPPQAIKNKRFDGQNTMSWRGDIAFITWMKIKLVRE